MRVGEEFAFLGEELELFLEEGVDVVLLGGGHDRLLVRGVELLIVMYAVCVDRGWNHFLDRNAVILVGGGENVGPVAPEICVRFFRLEALNVLPFSFSLI